MPSEHTTKRRKKRKPTARQRLGKATPRITPPLVHVQIASAAMRLDEAVRLVKPAILYADRVTLYSPAASLLNNVEQFAAVTDPRQRACLMFEVMDAVPSLRADLDVDPAVFDQLRHFVMLDPKLVEQRAASIGYSAEIAEMYRQLDALGPIWESQFPDALAQVRANLGADELLTAIKAGVVTVADISDTSPQSVVGQSVNAALGQHSDDLLDELVLGFVGRMIEILSDHRSFPLFDDHASGLVSALEQGAGFRISDLALRHGAEITSASGVLGYLPSFPSMPIDEIVDLRRELSLPVARFRSEWAKLSKEFRARPFDPAFAHEVEEMWRAQIEPALAEIREKLSEHGLLRENASITIGSAARLLAEAGGVVGLAHMDGVSLPTLLAGVLAFALPVADNACHALANSIAGRREVSRHPFFFVHRVAQAAEQPH